MRINRKRKNVPGSIEEMLKNYLQFIIDQSCYILSLLIQKKYYMYFLIPELEQ